MAFRKYGRPRTSTRRSRFLNSRSTARNVAVRAKRSVNKAVARTQRKTFLSRPARNTDSIVSLARQVANLQKTQIGLFQKNYEICKLHNHGWHDHAPFAFPLNNFLKDECRIFQATEDTTSHPGHIVPAYVVRNQFAHWSPTSPLLSDQFNYWAGANSDSASFIAYRPISTTLNFKFTAPALPPNVDYWVRIDIVQCKKTLPHSNVHSLTLPNNLLALGNLAHDDIEKRNRINRQYFKIHKTKWLRMHNDKNSTNTTIEKWCKIHWKFNQFKKSSTEDLDAGAVIDTVTGPVSTTFETQMPKQDIYWVILSTSNQEPADDKIEVDISRYISYRDQHGVAS